MSRWRGRADSVTAPPWLPPAATPVPSAGEEAADASLLAAVSGLNTSLNFSVSTSSSKDSSSSTWYGQYSGTIGAPTKLKKKSCLPATATVNPTRFISAYAQMDKDIRRLMYAMYVQCMYAQHVSYVRCMYALYARCTYAMYVPCMCDIGAIGNMHGVCMRCICRVCVRCMRDVCMRGMYRVRVVSICRV